MSLPSLSDAIDLLLNPLFWYGLWVAWWAMYGVYIMAVIVIAAFVFLVLKCAMRRCK